MIVRSYQTPHRARVVQLPAINGSAPQVRRLRDYIDIRAKPMVPMTVRVVPSILEIQRATAAQFDIPDYEMESQRRSKTVAYPRQVAMYLARALTSNSLPAIGRHFGGRDHSTVMHAIRRAEEHLAADPKVGVTLRAICARVAVAVERRDWEFRRRAL